MQPHPEDPSQLGKYRVVGRLGDGELGQVYLGEAPDGRRAALRVVRADLAADPGFRDRFRQEVQAAAAAPPWFVAPVLDADPESDLPWVATAFIEGPSLRVYVGEHGPLAEAGVSALAVRMADGLAALHGAGLVHRDLRPSNVLLADDGPRLIDFGIARAADALTQKGRSVGSAEYLSPEQAAGVSAVGPASDMFSLGSVLGYAATGHSPFAADSAAASLHRVVEADPDLAGLDGTTRDVLTLCLDKDPARRATAGQVAGFLRTAQAAAQARTVAVAPVAAESRAAPGPAPSSTTTARHGAPSASLRLPPARVLVAVAVLLVVLVGGALAFTLFRTSPTAAAPTAAPAPTPAAAASTSPAAPVSDPAAGTAPVDPSVFGIAGPRFASRSRNIACRMTDGGTARCDVTNRAWVLPPTPADCTLAYGQGAQVEGTGPGTLTCAGDTVADPAATVLDYGQSVTFAGIVCVSRDTGVRCTVTATGHGFRVSRATYELF